MNATVRISLCIVTTLVLCLGGASALADPSKCNQGTSLAIASGELAECLRDLIKDETKKCILTKAISSTLEQLCENDCIRMVDDNGMDQFLAANIDGQIEALGLNKPNLNASELSTRRFLQGKKQARLSGRQPVPLAASAGYIGCIAIHNSTTRWDRMTDRFGDFIKKAVLAEEAWHHDQARLITPLAPDGASGGASPTGSAANDLRLEMGANTYMEIMTSINKACCLTLLWRNETNAEKLQQIEDMLKAEGDLMVGYGKKMCGWLTSKNSGGKFSPTDPWIVKFNTCKQRALTSGAILQEGF